MSPRFVLGLEKVLCIAEVVNRSLKADCTDFTYLSLSILPSHSKWERNQNKLWRGHGVATGALLGVPSEILIQPHFHSQGIMPFCSGRFVLVACQTVA